MNKPLSLTWDLEPFFPGGVEGAPFKQLVQEIRAAAGEVGRGLDQLLSAEEGLAGASGEPLERLAQAVEKLVELSAKLHEAAAYTVCATAQDVADEKAQAARATTRELGAGLNRLWKRVDEAFLAMSDEDWRAFLALPGMIEIAFPLDERRRLARRAMSPDKEALAGDLAVDGYHAWGEMYNRISGAMRVEVEGEDGVRALSVAQAQNQWSHHPDRDVRRKTFLRYEEAWQQQAGFLAECLNHIGGFRLALYRNRGWDDILFEPLADNRMRRETLEAMWDAVAEGAGVAARYLRRKAKVLGAGAPAYYDVDAPVGAARRSLEYDRAAEMIVDTFDRFSPAMARLARKAFENRWIEAEDRPGKRAGGFCTHFPLSRQSRIFLTYDNSAGGAATLAHELGHAFHNLVLSELPYPLAHVPMGLAETASTLAEKLVTDASKEMAGSREERLAIVDDAAKRAVAFLMNIRARFEFELAFYRERRAGAVPPDRLSELMLEAQKEAYLGTLEVYHPLLWASKLHFYLTGTPFYNFPYTFGYLFGHGVLDWALGEGKGFEERYIRLLRDTGAMTVEELARRHMGVDLTQPDFWRRAVAAAVQAAEEFLELTEDLEA